MHCYHKEAAFGRPKTNTIFFCVHWIMLGLNRQTLKSHSKLGVAAELCYFQAMKGIYISSMEGSNIFIEQNIATKKSS